MDTNTKVLLAVGGLTLAGIVTYQLSKKRKKFYVRDIQGGKPYLCHSSEKGENCSSVSFASNQNFQEDTIGGSDFNYKADLNKSRDKTYIRIFDKEGNIVDSLRSNYGI